MLPSNRAGPANGTKCLQSINVGPTRPSINCLEQIQGIQPAELPY
jgi:hypothetical protein